MSSTRRRSTNRHSFFGTAAADETRKEKRYNHVRQRRLSAFQERVELTSYHEGDFSFISKGEFSARRSLSSQRKRSNSLPDSTLLKDMISKMETATFPQNPSRPRSDSFDVTTKLYTASAENDIVELEKVLGSGKVDPNRLYLSGIAPLHVAAAEGHLEAIKILVHYGANINISDVEGCSPLEFALRGAHFDCSSFLIKAGAETTKIIHGLK